MISDLIEYEKWSGIRYPEHKMKRHTPIEITLHHSATDRDAVGNSVIRGFQRHHIQYRDFDDIGYHYVIQQDQVYEGRKPYHKGAHCVPNTGKVGVCVQGNYDKDEVLESSYKRIIEVCVHLCKEYNISPDKIKGHRDYMKTSCPGNHIYNLLPKIRKDVKQELEEQR